MNVRVFLFKSPLHVLMQVLQDYPEMSSCKIYSIMMTLISCLPTHFWLEGMGCRDLQGFCLVTCRG